jgi:hypothetical protein
MENIYQSKFMYHLKSSKYILIGMSLIILFYFVLFAPEGSYDIKALAFGFAPVFLILFAPALYLHITYYFKNFRLVIKIDESQDVFTISNYGNEQSHKFSEIISIEQHLGLYYKNRIDRLGRRIAPWTPYGYLLLKLDDGKQYYLTSLMVDIRNSPLTTTHTYFRFFPYLKQGVHMSQKRITVIANLKNKISSYKATFKNHTDQQLNEKIVNQKTYDKASVQAAKQVLSNRKNKVGNNISL